MSDTLAVTVQTSAPGKPAEHALHLYRCKNDNCSTQEFTAAGAVCPDCQADGPLVHELVIIHFDPPSKYPHRGLGVRACEPRIAIGRGRGTGEHTVVNCPACKATRVFQETYREPGGPEAVKLPDQDVDFEVTNTPDGPVVTKG